MLLHSAMWMRSEEIYVSSGQHISIILLGLIQKMKVISFSISCINEEYVPFSLMLLSSALMSNIIFHSTKSTRKLENTHNGS